MLDSQAPVSSSNTTTNGSSRTNLKETGFQNPRVDSAENKPSAPTRRHNSHLDIDTLRIQRNYLSDTSEGGTLSRRERARNLLTTTADNITAAPRRLTRRVSKAFTGDDGLTLSQRTSEAVSDIADTVTGFPRRTIRDLRTNAKRKDVAKRSEKELTHVMNALTKNYNSAELRELKALVQDLTGSKLEDFLRETKANQDGYYQRVDLLVDLVQEDRPDLVRTLVIDGQMSLGRKDSPNREGRIDKLIGTLQGSEHEDAQSLASELQEFFV